MVVMGKDGFVKGVYGGRGAKKAVCLIVLQAERPPDLQ